MMRLFLAIALLLAVSPVQTAPPATQQTPASPKQKSPASASRSPKVSLDPDEGSIEDGVYTSDFFQFSYTLPDGFSIDEEFLADLEDQSKSTFVLLAAQGPLSGEDRRDMVVILADRDATTAEAYLHKVTSDYAQKQTFEVIRPAYAVTLAGKPFYRADFRKEGTYQSAVFTVLKGYAIGFSLAAPNQDAMEALLESLKSVKFTAAKPAAPTSSKPPSDAVKPAAPKSQNTPPVPKSP